MFSISTRDTASALRRRVAADIKTNLRLMTVSEDLFEKFCRQRRILAIRVPTAHAIGEKRPDYRVRSLRRRARQVHVEVKEIAPTFEEATEIAKVLSGQVGSFSTEPGAKMRAIIRSAAPQLKAVAELKDPAIVVVNEPSGMLKQHIDPYGILTAMRGLDVVPIFVPKDPRISPWCGKRQAGGKRKMTRTSNTTISAIALLFHHGLNATRLDVFHNRFARCPLRRSDLQGRWIRHFAMTADLTEWRLISSS